MSDGIKEDLGRLERMDQKEKQRYYPFMCKFFGSDFQVDMLTRHGFSNAHIIRPSELERILSKYVENDFKEKFIIKHTVVKRKNRK